MTTLIIDNYDSFTWNLHQLVGALAGEPVVVRNDAIDLAGIRALRPDRIILSPGPGHPADPHRVGVMPDLIRALDVPILGVCLGHQCIVHTFGGTVVRGQPVHGKTSLITHDRRPSSPTSQAPFEAMRYHSLIAGQLPPVLIQLTTWIPGPQGWESRMRREAPERSALPGVVPGANPLPGNEADAEQGRAPDRDGRSSSDAAHLRSTVPPRIRRYAARSRALPRLSPWRILMKRTLVLGSALLAGLVVALQRRRSAEAAAPGAVASPPPTADLDRGSANADRRGE